MTFDFYNRGLLNWKAIDQNLNIFLLINLNVILLIVLVLLLFRNVIKLMYERKKRLLGFKLKQKLTIAFVIISTLPMLLFFFVANGFLSNSMNFWFQGQFSVALRDSAVVVKNFSDQWDRALTHFANVVVSDILHEGIPAENQDEWFRSKLYRYQLDGIILSNEELVPQKTYFADAKKSEMWTPLKLETLQAGKERKNLRFDQSVENGHIYRALVPVSIQGDKIYVEVVRALAGSWYTDLETVRRRLGDFTKLMMLEDPIRTNYSTYLLLLTGLISFASIWLGVYLARGIVEPIDTLVQGTKRISRGDLDFQIDIQADDEIGILLNAFNKMTRELKQNRVQLAKSQEELIETNQVLEARMAFVSLVLDNIPSGVFSMDNSGYVNWINPAMMELMQVKHQDPAGKHYKTVLTKEQFTAVSRLEKELMESGEHSRQDHLYLTMGKRTIHTEIVLHNLNTKAGEPIGKLLVVNDLTELDRSTRAQAWREVARRIAHEIKNPLTPIQLSAQRLRRKYMDKLEDSQYELLDACTTTIISEVDSLKSMVNEFSKFARMREITPSPANLNVILQEAHDLFAHGIHSNNDVHLHMNLDPDVPDTMLDAEQMRRVFTNLLDNALAALEGEGSISLKSEYNRELKIIKVLVKDTGIGVPPHMMSRVFEPYVTSKKEGTGLGLAIVNRIISDHGGFIRLTENKPKGTVFVIELPT